MNHVVNIADFDPALSQLVDRLGAGEEVVLERGGKPVARLVSVVPAVAERRGFGILKDVAGPAPEGAFDPLSEEELALWYADIPPELK